MGKTIYQPKGAANEYGQWACNLYNGCSNKCDYCYNRHCPQSITLGGDKPTLKKSLCLPDSDPLHAYKEENELNALHIFYKEFEQNKDEIIRDGGLFFSFVSDPMLPETRSLSMDCADYAMDSECKVTMLTKCLYLDTWATLRKDLLRPGWTLTGMDSMEHGDYDTGDRIDNMRRLHELGCKTWASIEPVVDFDCALDAIVRSADCCDFYKIGLASKIGKQYTQFEVIAFAEKVRELVKVPIYWKDSVRNHIDLAQYVLPNMVGADYQF